jgi:ATP-dependent RNA helicase DeaD
MNIGDREGVDPKRFLGIINDVTGDKSISIGAIEVTNKFTFFDVFADQVDKVVSSFEGIEEYEVSEAKGSKTFEGGGSRKPEYRSRGSYGGGESRPSSGGYRGGDRADRPARPATNDGGGYRGGDRSTRPSSSTDGGDKPWRNRESDNRSSRPSSGGGDRRKSSGGGAGYKKKY